MTLSELIAEGRKHDAAMDRAPWFSAESRWQSDCVLTGAPDADMTNDGRVIVQANSNFPYRANLDGIAWLGTHRAELLALAEEALRLRDENAALRLRAAQLANRIGCLDWELRPDGVEDELLERAGGAK